MENNKPIKYLMGGKLGDFIHSLVVCKRMYEKTGKKAILYISNIGDPFEMPLEFTYNELKPILESQEWLSEFNIYESEQFDICLNDFRDSPLLYKTNWLNIYFNSFLNEPAIQEYKWIEMPKNPVFSNSLIINRALTHNGRMNLHTIEKYSSIAKNFNERYFVCFNQSQYDNFQLKDYFNLIVVENLYEYFEIINSSKLFMGNQSGPFAWASAMNVSRILEISRFWNGQISYDGIHYLTDDQYYKNFAIM